MSAINLMDMTVKYFQDRVKNKAKGRVYIVYNAYTIDSKGVPVNNIDDVAVCGDVRFFKPIDPFSTAKGKAYKSRVVTNPKWLDIAILANSSIKKTKDYTYVILNGIEQSPYGNNIYTFCLGRADEDALAI